MSLFDRVRVRDAGWWLVVGIALSIGLYELRAANLGLVLGFQAGLVGWLFWLTKRHRLSIARLTGPMPGGRSLRLLGIGVLFPLISIITTVAFYGPLSYVAPEYVAGVLKDGAALDATFSIRGAYPALRLALLGVTLVFTAPALEELVFRGVLVHRWTHRWGLLRAVTLSSALFGLLHVDKVGGFLMGLTLCAVYVRTGSLWLSMAIHAANNGVALIASVIPALATFGGSQTTLAELRHAVPWGLAGAALTLPPLGVFLWRSFRLRPDLPYSEDTQPAATFAEPLARGATISIAQP